MPNILPRVGLIAVFITLSSLTHANWTDTEPAGRPLSQSYGLDIIDHYTGTSAVLQNDYNIQLGSHSQFPLVRSFALGSGALPGGYAALYDLYSLGQTRAVSSAYCSSISLANPAAFRVHSGSTVTFLPDHFDAGQGVYLSNSNWQLDCTPDDASYRLQLTSPEGLRYYYRDSAANAYLAQRQLGLPSTLMDSAGNYLRLNLLSVQTLELTSRFNQFVIDTDKVTINTRTEPIARFAITNRSKQLTVTYQGGGTWQYHYDSATQQRVCNPLGACVTVVYAASRLDAPHNTPRVASRQFSIPAHGSYSIGYLYRRDSDGALVTTANHGVYQMAYRFYEKWSPNSTVYNWQNGALLQQTQFDNAGTYTDKRMQYLQAYAPPAGTANASRRSHAVLKESVEKRWVPNAGGQFVWIGSVKKTLSDFDRYYRPQLTRYSYPSTASSEGQSPGASDLFPSIETYTRYAQLPGIHHLGLVAESGISGLPYKTINRYHANGLVQSRSENGRITRYDYGAYDELSRVTDPLLNVTTYHDYHQGVARKVAGPEGYRASRTVSEGQITAQTRWGNRTTRYGFDVFGKLEWEQPAEASRATILYSYDYPASGGFSTSRINGTQSETTHFNGLGMAYRVEVNGTGVGTGSAYHYKVDYQHNDDGSVKSQSVPMPYSQNVTDANRTLFKQHPNGLRYEIRGADGSLTQLDYIGPFEIKVTDKEGVVKYEKSRLFGDFGSEAVVEVRHPAGGDHPSAATQVNMSYLDNGLLDKVVAVGKTQYFNYNAEGLLASYSTPETGLVQYQYDANGQLVYRKINEDSPVRYQYDGLGRLTAEIFTTPSLNVTHTYDDLNRRQTLRKNGLNWAYTTDKDDQILTAQLTHITSQAVPAVINTYPIYSNYSGRSLPPRGPTGPQTVSHGKNIDDVGELVWDFAYSYSPEGVLNTVQYPDREVVGYQPNRIGQSTQVGDYISQIQYWPNGALKSLRYGNGLVSNYQQSADSGQISGIQHANLWSKAYQFSNGTYVSGITDRLNPAKSLNFSFDQLYQLKQVKNAQGGVIESFSYSPIGDLVRKQTGNQVIDYLYSPVSNRLSSVKKNGLNQLLGYSPDGRVMTYGGDSYGYSDDKLLVEYDNNNGITWNYLYDGNHNKLLTLKNGQPYHYTLYDPSGRLMFEERPASDVTSNLIYLDNRLMAKRDGQYVLDYVECDYQEDIARKKTYLYHRPVYLQKGTVTQAYLDSGGLTHGGTAAVAFVGDCGTNAYDSWNHQIFPNEGALAEVSPVRREKWLFIQQRDSAGVPHGSTGDQWLYEYQTKTANGGVRREYVSSGTWRHYYCYQHYQVSLYRRPELMNTGRTDLLGRSSGKYRTQSKSWRAWQRKPNFNCQNPPLDPNQIPWG
ncbi:hypothetical protein [Reinekea forsetii]|uniref:YD repeat protein-containing protein n=1 Tax=Reinekea forsetii TaxID=1336806 RepID=A0A2K8KQD6_9GAMM|nr:hypothetical protein [Reinekea forsetii]ATX76960.1 YD repeat protein-containing protein [Reinekea forsetii]